MRLAKTSAGRGIGSTAAAAGGAVAAAGAGLDVSVGADSAAVEVTNFPPQYVQNLDPLFASTPHSEQTMGPGAAGSGSAADGLVVAVALGIGCPQLIQ
jgi:hypothetical protein